MSVPPTSTSKDQAASVEEKEHELSKLMRIERKRILRKLDLHLLPWVVILYLMSFLDRANIGNAKVAGLSKDLNLVGLQYNIAAAVFFIPFALFEVPSNIILKIISPSKWIPSIMMAWGIVVALMCLVKSYQGLVAARFFLGLTESGLLPGVTYYLSQWYPRKEQGTRLAIFFAASTGSGAFGGILAFGISKMEGVGNLHGWQWIFCLEGLGWSSAFVEHFRLKSLPATIIIAMFAFIYMQDLPEVATFLTKDERVFVIKMRREDQPEKDQKLNMKHIMIGLKDYKTFLFMILNITIIIPAYSIALFAPPIINELGFSAANAQLLTVPVFMTGCIFTVIFGLISDHLNCRGPIIAGSATVTLIGYIVLYTQTRPGVAYVGAVLATGTSVATPPLLAWMTGNTSGDLKRAVVVAMAVGTGTLGGICSSFIYMSPPRYLIGHGVNIGCLCLHIITTLVSMWNFNRLNKRKIGACKSEGIDANNVEEYEHMGDASFLFRYVI